jgi:hypothetical protein
MQPKLSHSQLRRAPLRNGRSKLLQDSYTQEGSGPRFQIQSKKTIENLNFYKLNWIK